MTTFERTDVWKRYLQKSREHYRLTQNNFVECVFRFSFNE